MRRYLLEVPFSIVVRGGRALLTNAPTPADDAWRRVIDDLIRPRQIVARFQTTDRRVARKAARKWRARVRVVRR